jgi:hypothetical protein
MGSAIALGNHMNSYYLIILSASKISPITRSKPKNLNVYFVIDSGKNVSNMYPFSAPYFFAKPVNGHFIPLATKTMTSIPTHTKATIKKGPKYPRSAETRRKITGTAAMI